MDALLPSTAQTPDAPAVVVGEQVLTWRDLEVRACRVANGLRAAGLTPGDRWAILARNCLEWPELVLGNLLAGTRYVPLNWHLTVGELEYLLDNSGATLLIVDRTHEATGREAAARAGIDPARVVVIGSDFGPWRDSHTDTRPSNDVAGGPLLYTGGTTGPSKGVVRADSGQTIQHWMRGQSTWGGFLQMPERGRVLITTPLYHGFGTGILAASLVRQHSVFIHERFEVDVFLATVERHRITSIPLVPTLMVRLAKLDDATFRRHDLSSVAWITHTAAPCPPWAKSRLIDIFGPVVVEFYGSSEGTGPVVCTSREWLERPGTVGRPAPILRVSVVDDQGRDLAPGEIGTLYFARAEGPPAYHGDDEKTRASRLPDGRFTVGDLGYTDVDGFVYLVDRRVDLILSGGVNIYPAEIEGVISQHPSVRDVAVFGVPDPEFGQQVKAAVELEAGASLDIDALRAWCGGRLAPFKIPRTLDVHGALPREAHGKLKKRLLRDEYWPSP